MMAWSARYKASLIAEWEKASGPASARIRWRSVRAQFAAILCAVIGVALAAPGGGAPKGKPLPLNVDVGLAFFVPCFVFVVVMFVRLRGWRREARLWREQTGVPPAPWRRR